MPGCAHRKISGKPGSIPIPTPPLWQAQILFYGHMLTRLLRFAAHYTGQIHDIRAALWTPGSLIIVFLAVRVVLVPFGI